MENSFQYDLEVFPIPTIVCDWVAAWRFRERAGQGFSSKAISSEEVAGLLAATIPLAANASALELFGAAAAADLNNPDCFRGAFIDWFRDALGVVGSGAKTEWGETIVHALDGRATPVIGSARSVIGPSGNLDQMIWSFIDVSRLKRAEAEAIDARRAAEDANAAKSIFLATMSHEIRTPLNGVLGMAQALESDALSPLQRERVAIIRESGEALLAILNDILDLSKIEAGRLELEELEFDLTHLANGAHSAFTALANKKQLSFALSIEPSAAGRYRGDPTRIKQILYNLISNALKFTEEGEVRVRVSRVDGELHLAVSDTGLGIPEDRLPALFAKFVQVDSSNTRRFGGTGLGLSICRDLATLMGGRISAESTFGEGSRFTVTLAIPRIGDATDAFEPAVEAASNPAALPRLKVLTAEDNTVNQLVLRTLLQQIDVETTVVGNGRLAVEAWSAEPWDVILMDVQMPEMDGVSAARAIRSAEAKAGRPRTPIIALSANAMSHQIAEYLAAGMDGHVAKPIDVRKLFAALEQIATNAHASAAAGSPALRATSHESAPRTASA